MASSENATLLNRDAHKSLGRSGEDHGSEGFYDDDGQIVTPVRETGKLIQEFKQAPDGFLGGFSATVAPHFGEFDAELFLARILQFVKTIGSEQHRIAGR